MVTDMDTKKQLEEIVARFDDAMVITRTPQGDLRARPMAVAKAERDGKLWFLTSMSSPKVDELMVDQRVCVTMQGDDRFVSLSGRGRLSRDRAKVEELWSRGYRAWFPKGKDDPDLVLLEFEPEEGEYWDQHGMRGIRYLFQAAKAIAKRERAGDGEADRHAKVHL